MNMFKIMYFWYHRMGKNTMRYKEGVADGVQGQRLSSRNIDYGIGHAEGTAIRADAQSTGVRLATLQNRAELVKRTVVGNL